MKKIIRPSILVLTGIALTGCATLFPGAVVKAPCGPTAGLTDPCGNSVPINTLQDIEDAQNSLIFGAIGVEI